MKIEDRLKELDIQLPQASKALASYLPGVKSANYVYTSGQLPLKEGEVIYQGKLGKDLDVEEGKAAAGLCLLNCLAVLRSLVSDWEDVKKIVKVSAFINSADDFYQQAQVVNGASDLLESIFGERGKHARSAVGVNSLPLNAACEIEMIVEL